VNKYIFLELEEAMLQNDISLVIYVCTLYVLYM